MMRFLAWGCGVQSTTLGEMSAQGILEPLDAIITADTQWERQATYEIRDFYAERWRKMGLRVEIVTAGSVLQLGAVEHIHIPFWTSDGGPLQRQCTRHFKLIPCKRKMREIAGFHPTKPPHPKPKAFEVWLGISLDESHRAKRNPPRYQHERWPLLERNMARWECEDWLKLQGLPVPVKSACIGCPYRQASEWLEMRERAPNEFSEAVKFDEVNRHNPLAKRVVEVETVRYVDDGTGEKARIEWDGYQWVDADTKIYPDELPPGSTIGGGSTADELFIYGRGDPVPLAQADLEYDAARERRIYGAQLSMFVCESGYCWV